MIKIIERGTKEQIKDCFKCGCKFSFEYGDVEVGVPHNYVECPQCERKIYIKDHVDVERSVSHVKYTKYDRKATRVNYKSLNGRR